MTGCIITVDRLDDGSYLASCAVFPELQGFGDTEDEAREALEEEIVRYLADQDHAD
jgi:predicted RNase H-like HicB family nuclease